MDTITAIATVPAVIALATIAKDMGFPVKLVPLLSIAFGVALQALQAMTLGGVDNWYEILAMGLILGLSASGLYDGAKAVGAKVNTPKSPKDVSI